MPDHLNMGNEADRIMEDLVEARLRLHHERCRRQQLEACLKQAREDIDAIRLGMQNGECTTVAIPASMWKQVLIRIDDLAAEKEALVQQGIRDHGDWRSKLNFLEADYKAEVARLTAENERLRKELGK